MGERKKKKRGQQREIIVPLPLDSTLNRLNNRAAQLHCTVSMNVRKTDRRELDVGIGYFGRNKRGYQTVSEFWRTTVTLEPLDGLATQVTYTPFRPQIFSYFPIIVVVIMWILITFAGRPSLSTSSYNLWTWIALVVLGGIVVLGNLLSLLDRRRMLVNLFHNLDKSLDEI